MTGPMARPGEADLLARQIELVRSDEWLKEKARAAAALSAEERLRMTIDLGRAAVALAARLPEELRARLAELDQRWASGAEEALRRWAGLGEGGGEPR